MNCIIIMLKKSMFETHKLNVQGKAGDSATVIKITFQFLEVKHFFP